MPAPIEHESQKDFIKRCVPIVIEDGTTDNARQAVAICGSLWRKHKSGKSYDGSGLAENSGPGS